VDETPRWLRYVVLVVMIGVVVALAFAGSRDDDDAALLGSAVSGREPTR
jgi:hypothetical protein